MKKLLAILFVLGLAYSTAPDWVAQGVSLNYSAGTDTLSFTVISRTTTQVTYQFKTISNSGNVKSSPTPTENATKSFGQFWFDSSSLDGAYVGETIGDFSVIDLSSQTFADKSWDTVTLEQIISGVSNRKTLDKKTGSANTGRDETKSPFAECEVARD